VSKIPADCLPFEEDLSALIDAELDEWREAEVRAHVEACPRCAGRLEALSDVDRALGEVPVPEVPADLSRRLAARLASDAPVALRRRQLASDAPVARRRRQPAPRGLRVAGALAAAAAVALVVLLGLPGEPPERGPQLARAPAVTEPRIAPEPTVAELEVAPEPAAVELEVARAPAVTERVAVDPVPERIAEVMPELSPAFVDQELEDVALLLAVDELADSHDLGLVANLEFVEMLVDLGPPEGA